jgi:hypothetical protein
MFKVQIEAFKAFKGFHNMSHVHMTLTGVPPL